ncbi:hypothetical protein BJY24_005695 [Nocardia transvalensis]|uniref:Uncharacterized protein n=1 Tax=Nocardia transvalensis TaxID=37333 RepID=A0A7W9PJC4_9NOCA|nr:hypothetical protein [Nocardia transvalensis]MBB5916783.1 hypothetical protein [Nocardia transvalensis]
MTSTEFRSLSDALLQVDYLLGENRHAEAREVFEHALTTLATSLDMQRLLLLADTFHHEPYLTARAHLTALWRRSPAELRAWLDTFVARTDPGLHRPTDQRPRPFKTVPLTAIGSAARRLSASDYTRIRREATPSTATEIRAKRARKRPEHIAALRAKRRPVREPRVVTDYIRSRFLVDADTAYPPTDWDRTYVRHVADQVRAERDRAGARTPENFDTFGVARTRTGLAVSDDERPAYLANGNGLDYDDTTLPPVQGWVCVYCFAERACADRFVTGPDGHRVSDDGLCQPCRDLDRPSIAALPRGFTLADEVAAYCRHLTSRYPAIAPRLLRQLQRRSAPLVRGLITAYLDALDQAGPEATVTPLRPVRWRRGRCCSCFTDQLIDPEDLCDDCRPLYAAAA